MPVPFRGPSSGRRWRRSLLLAALTIVMPAPVTGAQVPPRISFERIAQDKGLSHGTVTVMFQGAQGFLWFGTEDGLNRYDGAGFTTYRPIPGDTTALPSGWVTALAASRTGAFWVGTRGGGLNRFAPRSTRFIHYRHDPANPASLSSDQVNAVVEAPDGRVWVGTKEGLDHLDPVTGRSQRFRLAGVTPTPEGNEVLAVALDSTGALWVGARDGIFRLAPGAARFDALHHTLGTRQVRVIFVDRRGTVWIGTEDELLMLDPSTHRVRRRFARATPATPSPVLGLVGALWDSPDGILWVGGTEGLARLDPVDGSFTILRNDPGDPVSLGGNIVRTGLVDRGGVLWVGTESYGVSKYAPSIVHFLTMRHDAAQAHSLSDNYVRGIAEDRRGDLWIGTQFGGLNRLDARTGSVTRYRHWAGDPRSLPGDAVWTVLEDHAGVLWVGLHDHGLGTIDPATGAFTRARQLGADVSVNVLYEDRAGALLVGLDNKGLLEIAPDRRHTRFYSASRGGLPLLLHDDVQSILEDRDGLLWVGGAGGLTRLDRRAARATHFRAAPGTRGALGGEFVTNVVQDSRGTIWVATKGGGLNRFEPATASFTTLGTADGIGNSFVYGVLEDARRRLWLSTDDGIYMFDPVRHAATHYGLEDGLQAREFNRRAHLRGRDGTMYFGGVNGLNAFRPDAIVNAPPPPVRLVGLRVGDGPVRVAVGLSPDSVVRLRHDQNAFRLTYAALDFASPRKVRFAYRLEGLDDEWIPGGARNEASYASLAPGRYVFRVTAANATGIWNPVGTGVTIVIAPPWWGTWWARTAFTLAAIAAIWGLVLLRLRSVRRRNRWLESRVDEQTRDLRTAQAQLRAALEEADATARELIDITASVPGAVFQLSEGPDGVRRFDFVSDGIVRLFASEGGSADEREAAGDPRRIARAIVDSIDPADAESVEAALVRSRETLEPWHAEFRLARASRARWLSVQARPSRRADGGTTWTGVITDVTASRDAEAERAALDRTMQQAQKVESLGVLAGGMAHDFNNLLVGVLGSADLLRGSFPAASEEQQLVGHIRASAIRAAELTQQMLAYAGKGRYVVEPVELPALARDILQLLRSAVPRTIALGIEAPGAAPVVEADATQLRQVLMNLVTNASEAIGARPGHIRVRVAVVPAAPGAWMPPAAAPAHPIEGPCALLEVSDDGAGMDDALLTRIFDPFFTTKFTGRGLGLAATLGIVRAHRGGLQVETAAGRGTTFRVFLPLLRAIADPVPAPAVDVARPLPGVRGQVLVVDDEVGVRLVTERALRHLGYEPTCLPDGATALAHVQSGRHVDVALLDLTMPAMDGASLARELGARGARFPIAIMSGYSEEELTRRGVTADAFLKKPFTVQELEAALQNATAATPS